MIKDVDLLSNHKDKTQSNTATDHQYICQRHIIAELIAFKGTDGKPTVRVKAFEKQRQFQPSLDNNKREI